MFRKSITKRMFFGIIFVVVGFAVLILIANTLLLSPLYYRSLEKSMSQAASELSVIDFTADKNTWFEDIYSISSGNSFDIVVRNDDSIIFSSSIDIGIREIPEGQDSLIPNGPEPNIKPGDPFRLVNDDMEWRETDDNVFIGYSTDPRNNNEFIVCSIQNDDGFTIVLTQPVAPIDASITQSNQLLIICTAAMLVVSIVIALIFSSGFTKPIRKMKVQVERISNLEFDNKLEISTGDELENLGNDINKLSAKLRNALDELRDKNKQLEKDVIAQRKFISNASHELRTPLSIIKGYADEINSGYVNDSESIGQYLEIISEESTKLNRLLNEMLDLSRLDSGRMKLDFENIDINQFIRSFIDKYSGFIKDNGLDVKFEETGDVFTVRHDAMRAEQILANYISNAAKYSDSRKEIIISAKTMGDNVQISVFNYGKGIDEDSIERIWDGFYKADNSRTRQNDSYGLGLSIVKAIQTIAGQSYGVINHSNGVEFWFDAALAEKHNE
jgi:signal transduction histidine kinase